jgi:hypothetical protein
MPTTHDHPMIDALRRLAVTTLAYALAVGLVALALPRLLTPLPVAALLPEPPPGGGGGAAAPPPPPPPPTPPPPGP